MTATTMPSDDCVFSGSGSDGMLNHRFMRGWDLSFLDSSSVVGQLIIQKDSSGMNQGRHQRRNSLSTVVNKLTSSIPKSPTFTSTRFDSKENERFGSNPASPAMNRTVALSTGMNRSIPSLPGVNFFPSSCHVYQNENFCETKMDISPCIFDGGVPARSEFFPSIDIDEDRKMLDNISTSDNNFPWLTITSDSGCDSILGSRSQSVSSHESSDSSSEHSRAKDDSEPHGRASQQGTTLSSRGGFLPCRHSPSPVGEVSNTLEDLSGQQRISGTLLNKISSQRDSSELFERNENYARVARFLPAWDLERLTTVFRRLQSCRFYMGQVTFEEAKQLLCTHPTGTFMLRDSSHEHYLFSLSVQTLRGCTSIRIGYESGLFRLDSEPDQSHLIPTFDCVIRLVQYYVHLQRSKHQCRRNNNFVFLETSGRKDTPVLLRKPFEQTPSSLAHMCRTQINGLLHGKNVERLCLIPSLKSYLKDYPYDI